MGEQCQKVSLAAAAKRFKWTIVIAALKKDARVGMASDLVLAIGGASIAVYLLYGHPGCDWELT
eukprot:36715-Prorocentrum_lima.AAC.1